MSTIKKDDFKFGVPMQEKTTSNSINCIFNCSELTGYFMHGIPDNNMELKLSLLIL